MLSSEWLLRAPAATPCQTQRAISFQRQTYNCAGRDAVEGGLTLQIFLLQAARHAMCSTKAAHRKQRPDSPIKFLQQRAPAESSHNRLCNPIDGSLAKFSHERHVGDLCIIPHRLTGLQYQMHCTCSCTCRCLVAIIKHSTQTCTTASWLHWPRYSSCSVCALLVFCDADDVLQRVEGTAPSAVVGGRWTAAKP